MDPPGFAGGFFFSSRRTTAGGEGRQNSFKMSRPADEGRSARGSDARKATTHVAATRVRNPHPGRGVRPDRVPEHVRGAVPAVPPRPVRPADSPFGVGPAVAGLPVMRHSRGFRPGRRHAGVDARSCLRRPSGRGGAVRPVGPDPPGRTAIPVGRTDDPAAKRAARPEPSGRRAGGSPLPAAANRADHPAGRDAAISISLRTGGGLFPDWRTAAPGPVASPGQVRAWASHPYPGGV